MEKEIFAAVDKGDLYPVTKMRLVSPFEILPNEIEFFLPMDVLPGYAWIFPIGERTANIGLGMRTDRFKQTKSDLRELLDKFMAMPDIKARLGADNYF